MTENISERELLVGAQINSLHASCQGRGSLINMKALPHSVDKILKQLSVFFIFRVFHPELLMLNTLKKNIKNLK